MHTSLEKIASEKVDGYVTEGNTRILSLCHFLSDAS